MYNTQTITEAIGKLTPLETQTLFNLLRDHAGLIDKLVPGLPMIGHALGQQSLDHPLAKQYDSWLNDKIVLQKVMGTDQYVWIKI